MLKIALPRTPSLAGVHIGIVFFMVSCTTVPETGRKQFNFMSPGEEMQLGLSSFDKLKKETPISRDPALNAQIQRVGKRIAAVAPLPNAQFRAYRATVAAKVAVHRENPGSNDS